MLSNSNFRLAGITAPLSDVVFVVEWGRSHKATTHVRRGQMREIRCRAPRRLAAVCERIEGERKL
jgi:hypothetical protein